MLDCTTERRYSNDMNRYMSMMAILGGLFLGGCGGRTGWLLKPVPIDEELHETVVGGDDSWLVFSKIVIVDVDGILLNERQRGLFGVEESPVSLFIEKLDRAAGDGKVVAIILRINSPGGSVTASDIMYRRLKRFRSQRPEVPVIAIVEDVGASGAYYIACGATRILAHPTSVTGSIGVIMQTVSVAGTMKMLR